MALCPQTEPAVDSGPPPHADQGTPFFGRADWFSFGVTTVTGFTVYLATLAPEVGLGYSGIHATGAWYAGVPRSPGYPLWTLWAWAFTHLLGFSNVAWRAAVASAVPASLACGVIALMVSRGGAALGPSLPCASPWPPRREQWLRAMSGVSAGLVFGFSRSFWPLALIPDPWSLSILLLSIVLCLFMRWGCEPHRRRWLYAAMFLYGLLLTNSQIELSLAPAVPFIVVLIDLKLGRDLFLISVLLLVAGLIWTFLGSAPGSSPFAREMLFPFCSMGWPLVVLAWAWG